MSNYLNHNNNNFYNIDWYYNPICFNQQSYDYYQAQMQAYQYNQNQAILKASNAFSDFIDAVNNIDGNHQFELMLSCLAVFGRKMGW